MSGQCAACGHSVYAHGFFEGDPRASTEEFVNGCTEDNCGCRNLEQPASSPHERRVARAIDAIVAALQNEHEINAVMDGHLRPIAERIYQRAGRDVMEAFQSEMREADR